MTASADSTARVWPLDAAEGTLGSLAKLVHPTWVSSVSVEGDLVASGCGDGRVRLWSLTTFACMLVFEHLTVSDVGVRLAATAQVRKEIIVQLFGGVVISGGSSSQQGKSDVKIWAPMTPRSPMMEHVATITHDGSVRGLAASSAGFIVSSAAGGVKKLFVWRPGVSRGK